MASKLAMGPLALALALSFAFFVPRHSQVAAKDAEAEQGQRQRLTCSLYNHSHFYLVSRRVVTPDGVIPAAIEILDGTIVTVRKLDGSATPTTEMQSGRVPLLHFGSAVISPGLVDVHVHMNEPGRVEWEGVTTGTMAAAAGGVTTVVDMPLNSMPTVVDKETFRLKLEAVKGKMAVDVGFWGGLVPENAGNVTKLEEMLNEGVLGLKSFMCPSGINDFADTNATHFEAALPVLARYGLPLLVHAEVELPLPDPQPKDGDHTKYANYEASRPPAWEREAIRRLLEVASGTGRGGPYDGAHVHIVHLSDASSLPLILSAKEAGAALTVETCPHYLAFDAGEVGDGDTRFKCAPPIRPAANRALLWKALKDGQIDLISSDHSPCPPEMKQLEEGNFFKAWGGISGLQFNLPVTWTYGQNHNVTLVQLAQWWSERPAKLARLNTKGKIAPGFDADFVVWNPESSVIVEEESFTIFHKHKLTPYTGLNLSGEVLATFVRGNMVYREGGEHAHLACGEVLLATPPPPAPATATA